MQTRDQTLDELNASFAIPGILSFDEHGDLIRARITTPACTGELYLQGAHVTAWQPANRATGALPVGEVCLRSRQGHPRRHPHHLPVVRLAHCNTSKARAQTAHRTASRARRPGSSTSAPTQPTNCISRSRSSPPNSAVRSASTSFSSPIRSPSAAKLRLRLSVANDGDKPLHIEEALHTYLHVGDVEQANVHGLFETEYLDKTDNFARKTQTEPVLTLTGLTDRPYLNTTSPIVVDDPVLHRRITVTKGNSNTTVVWNPWANAGLADMPEDGWRHMLCVESANAAENALKLQPHEAHVMETTLSVEALA